MNEQLAITDRKSQINYIITNHSIHPTQIFNVRVLTSADVGCDTNSFFFCKVNSEKFIAIQTHLTYIEQYFTEDLMQH